MATAAVGTGQAQRVTLHCVSWPAYVGIGEFLREQPIRLTYDRGSLEIMTTSREHERLKKLLARLVETLTVELNVDATSGGSTTCKREDLERGLEPDECYWIEHEPQMRDKDTYDSDIDPPPDLALEVEISRNVLDRLGIYAALGIPEVWRYDGEAIQILILGPKGEYQTSTTSKALPQVPVAELAQFLAMRHGLSETQLIRQFRDWVQQEAPGWTVKKPRGRKKK
jgi:Uma2 family endonuclease